jgi:hypothetical protein
LLDRIANSQKQTILCAYDFRMKISAVILTAILAFFQETTAFTPPTVRHTPSCAISSLTVDRLVERSQNHMSTALRFGDTGKHHVYKTTLAGRLWPTIKKFHINGVKAKAVVGNIISIADWQDIALLGVIAFGAMPLAKLTYDRAPEEHRRKRFDELKRFAASDILSQIAKIALSIYAVDVVCVVLGTLGFTFPIVWGIPGAYAKIVYTCWCVKEFLLLKKVALCKAYKVEEENMGRVGLVDRLLNGIIVGVTSLLLFDWLSFKMGTASKQNMKEAITRRMVNLTHMSDFSFENFQ